MGRLKIKESGNWVYAGYGDSGYSGFSGFSGRSGYSGFSGTVPGGSGYSGFSGTSGTSGYSGAVPGGSGYSGFSGISGVQFVWLGTWNSGTTYAINDCIEYLGNSYVAILSGSNKDPITQTTYWQRSGSSGYSGFSSTSGYSGFSGNVPGGSGYSGYSGGSGYSGTASTNYPWAGVWDSGIFYFEFDCVSYAGSSYICIQEGIGWVPTNLSYWNILASSGYSGATGAGWSGYSGFSSSVQGPSGYSGQNPGPSGWSGYSGQNPGPQGTSGYSGFSGIGTSGYSGHSGAVPGGSGYSGFSGNVPGGSGYSGKSGYSGIQGIGSNIRVYTWVISNPEIGGVPGPRINEAHIVTRVDAYITTATSVSFNIEERETIGTSGSNILTSDQVTSMTGTSDISSFNDDTLGAGRWLWLDISAVSGAVAKLVVNLTCTI